MLKNDAIRSCKRGLSFLLALVMLMSCAGISAFAEECPHSSTTTRAEPGAAATCTEDGWHTVVTECNDCGEELSRRTVKTGLDKKVHTPGEPVRENVKEPTCTEKGSYEEVVYCTECNKELSRKAKVIWRAAHDVRRPLFLAARPRGSAAQPLWSQPHMS